MITSSQHKLEKELASISTDRWKNVPTYNSCETETVLWLPLFHISSENILGLTKSGYWTVGSDDSIVVFEPEMPLVSLLPCLEIEYIHFCEVAKDTFYRLGLPEELINSFPTSELIGLALIEGSEYWVELALNWLEYIKIDDQIREQLQQFAKAKWASQKARQKASKFLKGKIKQKV